ncbi:MAG: hypothetical protein COA85_01980 [Robiginitomaculum sp.]|nr:MAG: hypothetical protein COA85_01980 [Robiginitomaculum sp.]
MRIVLALVAWLSFAVPVASEQQASVALSYSVDGHLIVPVYVNEVGPFAFILDSAASRTIISDRLASELKLPLLTNRIGRLVGASGETETEVFRVETLRLAGRQWTLAAALALPPSSVRQGYAGILGLDVLSSQALLFDFDAQQLELLSDAKAQRIRRDRSWHKIWARRNFAGFLSVNLRINGRRVRAIVDSGARRSIGNEKLGALLENLSPASIMVRQQIITGVALSQVPARTGLARTVKLQSLRWDEAEILVADLAVFEALGLINQPAMILGLDFLQSTSSVMFDFSRQRLWIKP